MAADRNWSLTPAAFEGLLAHLARDRETAAQEYEKIRRKLLDYFTWRGAPFPSSHADETLDRVARRLEEGESVEHMQRYVYGVARHVLMESGRRQARERAAQADWPEGARAADFGGEDPRAACLDRCLEQLPSDTRTLIVHYYEGAGGAHLAERKVLAERLGISYGTLKTRAHRTRVELERCLRDCLGERQQAAP